MKLLMFVAKLLDDVEAQEKFTAAPEKTMTAAGLSKDEQRLLLTGDREGLATAIAEEIRQYKAKKVSISWAHPGKPEVKAINPDSGHRGKKVPVQVSGTFENEAYQFLGQDKQASVTCRLVQDKTIIDGEEVTELKTGETEWSFNDTFELGPQVPTGAYDVQVLYQGSVMSTGKKMFTVK
jgi:hypothetical protein